MQQFLLHRIKKTLLQDVYAALDKIIPENGNYEERARNPKDLRQHLKKRECLSKLLSLESKEPEYNQ